MNSREFTITGNEILIRHLWILDSKTVLTADKSGCTPIKARIQNQFVLGNTKLKTFFG
jgi:hypothetical protein